MFLVKLMEGQWDDESYWVFPQLSVFPPSSFDILIKIQHHLSVQESTLTYSILTRFSVVLQML